MLAKENFVAHYVIYTDDWFLRESIENSIDYVDKILIARTLSPWFGEKADLTETENILSELKTKFGERLEIYENDFASEQEQRNFLLEISRKEGYKGAFIIDADEIFTPESFKFLYNLIEKYRPEALRTSYLTFIKDASFVVSPPYETNLFYVSLEGNIRFEWARKTNIEQTEIKNDNPTIFHFSYLRKTDNDILRKIKNFMHSKDANWDRWYNEIYKKFTRHLKNFHPVYPETWSGLQLFETNKFPAKLYKKLKENGKFFYKERVLENNDIKLHLGCGDIILKEYINIDLYSPNAELTLDIEDLSYFDDSSVSEIFMNAVFEHIYTFQQIPALKEWKRVLKPGCKLIINSIPDFDIYAKAYLEKAPGNTQKEFDLFEVFRYTHGGYNENNRYRQIHKDIFTKEKVKYLLESAGFEIESIKNVHWKNEPIPCNINVIAVKPETQAENILLAEKYFSMGNFKKSREILENILSVNPNSIEAINDLAVLEIESNNFDIAENLISRALSLEQENEVALNNLLVLKERKNFDFPGFKIYNIDHLIDFETEQKTKLDELKIIQKYFLNKPGNKLKGICAVCGKITEFTLNEITENVNWREELICTNCKLNSCLRGVVHFLLNKTEIKEDSSIYLTEQKTDLFQLIKGIFPNTIGSEYSGINVPRGNINAMGIRNEDATSLTFENEQFDYIVSLEVLEHIPDYFNALKEFFRTLKKSGLLLLTVPFLSNQKYNIIKAYYDEKGKLKINGEAEYHGNPNNPEEGSLCYYYFGWELLENLREAGFQKAYAYFYFSRPYGYLQPDNLIVGVK